MSFFDKTIFTTLICLCSLIVFGQEHKDTMKVFLEDIELKSYKNQLKNIERLPAVHGMMILSGKKTEKIDMKGIHAHIAERNARQIFSRIPGAFVYDMDGSGNQLNISTRGLDPHRSWEFNLRQNGVMLNSDIYGYPASHYNQPMESIAGIEMIRGAAGLQHGAQMGGMINFLTKTAPEDKAFEWESINSIGSFGLLSTYQAVGGTIGKLSYYAYYHNRRSEGYRDVARSNSDAQFVQLQYRFAPNFSITSEVARSIYTYQIPGPLTDEQFSQNPRQATRFRNFYSPEIFIPSITIDWAIHENIKLQWKSSKVLGDRNSIEFVGFADRQDIILPQTGTFGSRAVNIDNFSSNYHELRLLNQYHIFGISGAVAGGIMIVDNHLKRRQLGQGSTGLDFDLSIEGDFGRDISFETGNMAFFIENMVEINSRFSITPGFRYERGLSEMNGVLRNFPDIFNTDIVHDFPLFGVSSEYKISENTILRGSWSQAYRPVILADITPNDTLVRVDPNLLNAKGFNADINISTKIGSKFSADLSFFMMEVNNRIGSQLIEDQSVNYLFRTNLGATRTQGMELYLNYQNYISKHTIFSVFTALSLFDGRYTSGNIVVNGENQSIVGNRIESVPDHILRVGLNMQYKSLSGVLLFSSVGETFADPVNTIIPTPNGAVGLVPSYYLFDLNLRYDFSPSFNIRAGINNLLNRSYFTKRPVIYPGPGVWPSDGRSFFMTFAYLY
jgi:Fe(3+) dicitrate transport protein